AGPSSLYIQGDAMRRFTIGKFHGGVTDTQVLHAERSPVSGNVRSEDETMRHGICFKPQHAAKYWTDHHGCRPDLVWRTGGNRLVVVAGKNFCDMTERAVEAEQSVRPEVRISRQRPMVAVFAHRGPPGEQRPYRTEVISARVVFRILRGNDAHAPIGLMLITGQLVEHRFALSFIEEAVRHGNRGMA